MTNTNSADPDQMPQNAASDRGLQCLLYNLNKNEKKNTTFFDSHALRLQANEGSDETVDFYMQSGLLALCVKCWLISGSESYIVCWDVKQHTNVGTREQTRMH